MISKLINVFKVEILYLLQNKKAHSLLSFWFKKTCRRPKDCHWLGPDLSPPHGADRNLVLSPGRRAYQYYQNLTPGRAGPNGNRQNCHIKMSLWQLRTVPHCLSAVKRVRSFTDCVLVTLNVNDDDDFDSRNCSSFGAMDLSKDFLLEVIRINIGLASVVSGYCFIESASVTMSKRYLLSNRSCMLSDSKPVWWDKSRINSGYLRDKKIGRWKFASIAPNLNIMWITEPFCCQASVAACICEPQCITSLSGCLWVGFRISTEPVYRCQYFALLCIRL